MTRWNLVIPYDTNRRVRIVLDTNLLVSAVPQGTRLELHRRSIRRYTNTAGDTPNRSLSARTCRTLILPEIVQASPRDDMHADLGQVASHNEIAVQHRTRVTSKTPACLVST